MKRCFKNERSRIVRDLLVNAPYTLLHFLIKEKRLSYFFNTIEHDIYQNGENYRGIPRYAIKRGNNKLDYWAMLGRIQSKHACKLLYLHKKDIPPFGSESQRRLNTQLNTKYKLYLKNL